MKFTVTILAERFDRDEQLKFESMKEAKKAMKFEFLQDDKFCFELLSLMQEDEYGDDYGVNTKFAIDRINQD